MPWRNLAQYEHLVRYFLQQQGCRWDDDGASGATAVTAGCEDHLECGASERSRCWGQGQRSRERHPRSGEGELECASWAGSHRHGC